MTSTVVSCFAWFLSLTTELKLRTYKYVKTNVSGSSVLWNYQTHLFIFNNVQQDATV
jgi:hypothetical protein